MLPLVADVAVRIFALWYAAGPLPRGVLGVTWLIPSLTFLSLRTLVYMLGAGGADNASWYDEPGRSLENGGHPRRRVDGDLGPTVSAQAQLSVTISGID